MDPQEVDLEDVDRLFQHQLFENSSLKAEYEELNAKISEKEEDIDRLQTYVKRDREKAREVEAQGQFSEAQEHWSRANRRERDLQQERRALKELQEQRQRIPNRVVAKFRKLAAMVNSDHE